MTELTGESLESRHGPCFRVSTRNLTSLQGNVLVTAARLSTMSNYATLVDKALFVLSNSPRLLLFLIYANQREPTPFFAVRFVFAANDSLPIFNSPRLLLNVDLISTELLHRET